MSTTILQIRKDHLPTTRWHERADEPLAPGQVRVRIDRFALTSNNITYAAFGEAMNYWRFYPTGEEGWGVIPVWGFATVVESTHPEVPVGEVELVDSAAASSLESFADGGATGTPPGLLVEDLHEQVVRAPHAVAVSNVVGAVCTYTGPARRHRPRPLSRVLPRRP